MNIAIPRLRLLFGNTFGSPLLSYTNRGPRSCCLQLRRQSEGNYSRTFSSSPSSSTKSESISTPIRLEDANPERIRGIKVNSASLGYTILPGNFVFKTYKLTGNTRKIPVELAKGYFWMVWDLKKTNQKPTLSNEKLIPARDAQLFPTLKSLYMLDDSDTELDLPLFFLEKAHHQPQHERSTGKITLVAITFRDNGFKLIPTWTVPFEQAFRKNNSLSNMVQTFHVNITERWILYPFRNTIRNVMKNNTSVSQQSKTLTYFGTKEVMEFRDVLRMHNIMTSYVFLLDDLGRVRFAGSGEASEDEVTRLIKFAKALLRECDTTFTSGSAQRRSGAKKRSTRK